MSDIMREGGIYYIHNIETGKVYIGSAKCFFKRYQRHRRELTNNVHYNKHLQNSFNKHTSLKFYFKILELCKEEELINREQYWLDFYTPYKVDFGYNVADVAGPTMNKGKSPSKETRKKISETLKSKNIISPKRGTKLKQEVKDKISKKVKSLNLKGKALPQSIPIQLTDIEDNTVKTFETISELAKKFKSDRSTIKKYCNNKQLFRKKYYLKFI